MSNDLLKTPLYQEHLQLKARMVPFGGWEMPVQYEGIIAEYQQTRTKVSLFDTSHMGEFIIEGGCEETGLNRIVTMSLLNQPVKSCRYGFLLNEDGGVIDDLIVYRLEEEKWMLIVNGGTIEKDKNQILKHLTVPDAFTDISAQTVKLDVQGPESRDVLKGFAPGIEDLDYYTFDTFGMMGENVLISRTGYTGELGFEIYCSAGQGPVFWNTFLQDDRVKPAGLGARDILRLEVGYPLYGHELDDQTVPLEAGLKKFIDMEKDFVGKDALLKRTSGGLSRKLIGFVSDTRRSPRAEQTLYLESGEEAGTVTSGSFSPYLEKGIGLGYVKNTEMQKGEKIYFGTENSKNSAIISNKIFYTKGSLKN